MTTPREGPMLFPSPAHRDAMSPSPPVNWLSTPMRVPLKQAGRQQSRTPACRMQSPPTTYLPERNEGYGCVRTPYVSEGRRTCHKAASEGELNLQWVTAIVQELAWPGGSSSKLHLQGRCLLDAAHRCQALSCNWTISSAPLRASCRHAKQHASPCRLVHYI